MYLIKMNFASVSNRAVLGEPFSSPAQGRFAHVSQSALQHGQLKLVCRESIRLPSRGEWLAGELFMPLTEETSPAIVICHGAGEFKEHYFEMAEYLAQRGIGVLTIDMHGHGASQGKRFHCKMREWVADVQAALNFLSDHNAVNAEKLGGFGVSSGGTALIEAALADDRLKSLVLVDATVRNSVPAVLSAFLRIFVAIGTVKCWFTHKDLRVDLTRMSGDMHFASDPEVNARLLANPAVQDSLKHFPFPGAAEAFFVDTIKKVPAIGVPTLVLWGEDDELDPPESGRMLYEALTCKKQIEIIPGNGHAGHLDRNKKKVFELATQWLLENCSASPELSGHRREQSIPEIA